MLNERDKERLRQYNSRRYSDLFEEADEKELVKTAKAIRKEKQLPKAPLNPEDITTYKNFIVTKPKVGSPLADFQSEFGPKKVGELPANAQVIDRSLYEKTLEPTVKGITKVIKEAPEKALTDSGIASGTKFVAKTAARVFDKPVQVINKGFAGSITGVSIVYETAKEFKNSIKEDRDFNILNTEKGVMDIKEKTEYIFGSTLDFKDYLDIRTAQEKRNTILEGKSIAEQQELKGLDNLALAADVVTGIATGVGISKGLSALIGRGGVTGRIAQGIQKVADPSLTNMAKLGGLVGASAAIHYAGTGEWLFDGDAEAQEGAFILGGSSLMKLAGEGGKAVFKNKEFQKGVHSFFESTKEFVGDKADEFATYTGARANFVADTGKPNKEISNTLQELAGLQDVKTMQANIRDGIMTKEQSLEMKTEYVNKLVDDGIMEYKGVDAKGNDSYVFTDKAKNVYNIGGKNSSLSFLKEGVHLPTGVLRDSKGRVVENPTVKRIRNLDVQSIGTTKETKKLIEDLNKNYGLGIDTKLANSEYFNNRIRNAIYNTDEAERILENYNSLSKKINDGDFEGANNILDESFPFTKRLDDSIPIETLDSIDSAIGKKIAIIGKESDAAGTATFKGESGRFTPSKQEIILFDTPDERTFIHEFSHNLEQFITKQESDKLKKLYEKSINKKIDEIYGKTADIDKDKIKQVLQRRIVEQPGNKEFGITGEKLDEKIASFFNDKVFGKLTTEQKNQLYRFANSSEFFAEELADSFYRGIKKEGFIKELLKKVKGLFNSRERFFNNLGKSFREGNDRVKRNNVFTRDVLKDAKGTNELDIIKQQPSPVDIEGLMEELIAGKKAFKKANEPAKPTFTDNYNKILGKFVETGNKNIGVALGDTSATLTKGANRTVQRELEGLGNEW